MAPLTQLLLATLLLSSPALAADKPAPSKETAPSAEVREKMAKNHEKMAACLRSDKPVQDCRKEMMETCRKDKTACPAMGRMGRMNGKMHRGMRGHGPMGGPMNGTDETGTKPEAK
ncbi:MAG: hypothetical protein A2428_06765 [Bdellovibrionales bacterium RIFOXYC1_FULL_54_43]|nr:MAG: hypothetical protein A2428_06765 [Bdellovibrionales bacterium RIFOXYC1_FULL_54_43]